MTLLQLEYILDINRTGSISQTAKNFYISQTTVSRSVSMLEAELGIVIFHRRWDGVVPTRQGIEVLAEANLILDSCQRIKSGQKSNRRQIRFSMFPFFPILDAFVRLKEETREDQSVSLSQVNIESEDVADQLAMLAVDLCLIAPISPTTRSWMQQLETRGMNCQLVGTIPAVLRISPAHPLYHVSNLTAYDFRDETLIDRGRLANSPLVKGYLPVNNSRVQLVDNISLQEKLRDAGLGYTISLPAFKHTADREIPFGMEYNLIAVTNPRQVVQPEVLRFLDLMEERLGPKYGKASLSPNLKK